MSHSASLFLVSVQLAQARKVMISGRSILTAIHKTAALGPVQVGVLGLEGDEQADLSVHGGLEKAVYAYPAEHYPFWQSLREHAGVSGIDTEFNHGALGENLTISGLLEAEVWVGDLLRFHHCTLRVSQPREPCYKFNAAMGFNTAVKEMALSGFCGFYLRVDEPGTVQAGEPFELLPGPRNDTIAQRFQTKVFKHLR
jgi:MOSC domain-containing protein YiiM